MLGGGLVMDLVFSFRVRKSFTSLISLFFLGITINGDRILGDFSSGNFLVMPFLSIVSSFSVICFSRPLKFEDRVLLNFGFSMISIV